MPGPEGGIGENTGFAGCQADDAPPKGAPFGGRLATLGSAPWTAAGTRPGPASRIAGHRRTRAGAHWRRRIRNCFAEAFVAAQSFRRRSERGPDARLFDNARIPPKLGHRSTT